MLVFAGSGCFLIVSNSLIFLMISNVATFSENLHQQNQVPFFKKLSIHFKAAPRRDLKSSAGPLIAFVLFFGGGSSFISHVPLSA